MCNVKFIQKVLEFLSSLCIIFMSQNAGINTRDQQVSVVNKLLKEAQTFTVYSTNNLVGGAQARPLALLGTLVHFISNPIYNISCMLIHIFP